MSIKLMGILSHTARMAPELRPRQSSQCRVAIIGGGFSGGMLAAQLLRRDPSSSVRLVDPAPVVGLGVAYATTYASHLLNVPAGNMSALPDDPEHFVRWAQRLTGRNRRFSSPSGVRAVHTVHPERRGT